LINVNRFAEAKEVLQQAQQRHLDDELLWMNLYSIAFNQGDSEEMHRLVTTAPVKAGLTDALLNLQSATESFHGRLKKARELSTRAHDFARQNDDQETAANYLADAAFVEVESGDHAIGTVDADRAVKAAPARGVQLRVALVFARASDARRAQVLAEGLAKRFPLDTLVNSLWKPTIDAAVELDRGHAGRALELLEVTSPYEQSSAMNSFSIYLRGLAFLKTGEGAQAAAEFQRC
jgi:hypothetical protein